MGMDNEIDITQSLVVGKEGLLEKPIQRRRGKQNDFRKNNNNKQPIQISNIVIDNLSVFKNIVTRTIESIIYSNH